MAILAPPIAGTENAAGESSYWLVTVAAMVLAAIALAWVWLRRRRVPDTTGEVEAIALPPAASVVRARLALQFRPVRAGLNLLSATSENEVILTNRGDAVAVQIRLGVSMIAANAGQDAELAAFYAEPIVRPVTPPFDLAAGEQRTIATVAALRREAITPLTAAGRPMVVPIVAVHASYTTEGAAAQTAQAFAIGVERVDSAKLAPFWLDALPKTFNHVAARPQGPALET